MDCEIIGIPGTHHLTPKGFGRYHAKKRIECFGDHFSRGGVDSFLEICDEGPGELRRDIYPGGVEFCRRCGLFSPRALDVLFRKKIIGQRPVNNFVTTYEANANRSDYLLVGSSILGLYLHARWL